MTAGITLAALEYLINAVTRIDNRFGRLEAKLNQLTQLEQTQMANLDQLVTLAHAQTTVAGSLVALAHEIKNQLDTTLANAGAVLSPEMQAKVDDVFATITGNSQAIADAVVANTPAAPPVEEPSA